jgi:hypothetical protein
MLIGCRSGPAEPTTTTTTEAATSSTVHATTSTVPPLLEAPWSAETIAAVEAPEILSEQWEAAENRETCAALAPIATDFVEPDATARAASFSGGWAVAWDRPNGPGMRADGAYCEDCGRSAFGVAGAGVEADEVAIRAWPEIVEWADGSLAGYGNEGFATDLVVTDPLTAGGVSPTKLAFLKVTGQQCLYNVWSRTSKDELLALIGRLRYVDGLGALPAGSATSTTS